MAESDTTPSTGITGNGDSRPASRPARPARPAQPHGTRPSAPKAAPTPAPAAARPVMTPPPQPPKARPAVPPQLRPLEPAAPAQVEEPQPDFAVYDDDSVIVPAPPIDALAQTHHHAARAKRQYLRSISARRTFIPVLLTVGVMLIVAATVRYFVGEDAPLATLPKWSSVAGYAAGGLLLIVALLNMLQVRSELARIDRTR